MNPLLLWLIPLLPLLGATAIGAMALIGSRSAYGPSRKFVGLIAVLMPAISCALTLAFMNKADQGIVATAWTWFTVAGHDVSFGLLFDELSSFMLSFITGIGSLIVLYSTGYMAEDRGYARFMAYLNLFLFSMIMLVMGDNLIVTFLGWEGVGLCSYLLIGFWHKDHENNDAARKAFIVNRVGDLGFLLGAFCLVAVMGNFDLSYQGIKAFFTSGATTEVIAANGGLLTAATLFIFLGCTGKSAQIPLLTWLPDAMAGPTPVSALIHAATMVTSGVFLLTRLQPVYMHCEGVLLVVTWVAALTALWAAIAGLMQWDIKKVLAYSTISQLGYMFLACGIGMPVAGLFHVFTHAFFKAALFLGAGSVIHALHHEQDMRKMGGLAKKLPHTHGAMLLAWWCIIGLPLGAGFFSKDLILELTLHDKMHGGGAMLPWIIGLVTAGITAIYMTRLMYYVFWSPSRMDPEVEAHVKEPGPSMVIPVVLLAIGALCAGTLWIPFLAYDKLQPLAPYSPFESWLNMPIGHSGEHEGFLIWEAVGWAAVSVIIAIIGWIIAHAFFKRGPRKERIEGMPPVSGGAASWTWGFDRIYDVCIVKPVYGLGCVMNYVVDQAVIRRLVDGIVAVIDFLAKGYKGFQRRYLRSSLAISVLGAVLILALVAWDILV